MKLKVKVGDMVSPTEGDLEGKSAIVMESQPDGWLVQFTKRVDRKIVRRVYPENRLYIQTPLEDATEAVDSHGEPTPGTESWKQWKWRGLTGTNARTGSEKAYRDATLTFMDQSPLKLDLDHTLRAYVNMPLNSGGCGGKFDYPQVLLTPANNALVFRGWLGWEMFYSFAEVRESNKAAMERVREALVEEAKGQAAAMAEKAKAATRGPYGFQEPVDNSYGTAYQTLAARTETLQTCCLLLAAALQNTAADLDASVGTGKLGHNTFHIVDSNTRKVAELLGFDTSECPGTEFGMSDDLEDLQDG